MADLVTTSLAALWLPILLSAVFVFIASFIIHMVIPIHKSDYKGVPDEARLAEAVRAQNLAPGEYYFPWCASMKEMKSPNFVDRHTRGPVGMLTGLLVWTDSSSSKHADWRRFLGENARRRPLYWLYYAVRVALALDGALGPSLRDALLAVAASQSSKGDTAGSFPATVDGWFVRGGATLQTAVVVLTMEHALFLR